MPDPVQPADSPVVPISSADPVVPDSNRPISTIPADPDIQPSIPAGSASEPVQANSPPVNVPTQTDSSLPADLTSESTASASSAVQSPASIVPTDVMPSPEIPISLPVSKQPEVAPEQVFEASASAIVAPQDNTPVASVSFGDISGQNPPQNSSTQPVQNPPESPIVSTDQVQQNTTSPPPQEPLIQPVEAAEQPSIHDTSSINQPVQVQPDVPVNTPSVSAPPSDKSRQESAGIITEPPQPIQNNQIGPNDGQKSSFGDLLDNKTDEVAQPTINIEPIEIPISKPPIQNSPPIVNPPTVQPTSDTGSAALRRQHAAEARKQKYAQHLNSVIELVQKKGKVDNLDVRDFLHVSQTTATDYLHVLVSSGKLKKDGKAKATTYSLL